MASDEELTNAIDSLTSWEIDSRQITVRLVEDLLASPVEVWTAVLQKPISGGSLPLDVMAELKIALESGGYPPPYLLDTRRGYTEWGASGVAEQVLLVVGWGLGGIVGNATYDVLRSTVARLARNARDDGTYGGRRSPGQAEAEERGRWAPRSAFDLAQDDTDRLRLVGAEHRPASWLVRYRLDERRYEVELLEEDGLVTLARVGWSDEETQRRGLAANSGVGCPLGLSAGPRRRTTTA
jgi:hypothetical protein